MPCIRVGPLANNVTSCSKRSSSVRWDIEDEEEAGEEQVGDLIGDMTRARDVRTVTGGAGDLTGEILPLAADMLAPARLLLLLQITQEDEGRGRS